MKKILLFIAFSSSCGNAFAQGMSITQLTAAAGIDVVNVNLKTVSGMGAGYLSNSHTIDGNTINLTVCFWFDNTLPVLQFNNDFAIPVPLNNQQITNVNVVLKLSTSQVTCDNFSTADTKNTTISFLSSSSFENSSSLFELYPNPSKGIFEFKATNFSPIKIEIFDSLGRLVSKFENVIENKLNLESLDKGIYLARFSNENIIFCQKIILEN